MLSPEKNNFSFLGVIKKYWVQMYFLIIFTILLLVYLPSFFDPLRSDYLPLFYFFHHLDDLPGAVKWLHLLNYDPLNQVNFYPLTHVIMYLEYLVFGSQSFYYHFLHFAMYCVSLILIYKLARKLFQADRLLAMMFITLFAFLFSHFDLIIWSYHIHIIFSFNLLLAGFILYLEFLKTGKMTVLILVIILFLLPLFCYLSFIFWPVGIIFLVWLDIPGKESGITWQKKKKSLFLVLGTVYSICLAVFFVTRVIGTYDRPLVNLKSIFFLRDHARAFFLVPFNAVYNGVVVNLLPFLAWPLKTCENIELGGWLNEHVDEIVRFILAGGGISLPIFVVVPAYFFYRKKRNLAKVSIFLFFLLFSEFFVLSRLCLLINHPQYVLQQFRYQYVVNAVVILTALLILSYVLGGHRKGRIITGCVLAVILGMNMYYSVRGAAYVNSELAPLNKIVYSIKKKIASGEINSENRIYIDDKITKALSPLCWNDYMGTRYMKHTYQWMFTSEEVKYFTFSADNAKWVVDEENLVLIKK
jgi:hypothetical protein